MKFVAERVENILEKGENAGYQHFLLFQKCFQKPPSLGLLTPYFIDTNLTHQQETAFENIVGKGEFAHNEQILLFPQCFLLNQITVCPFVIFLTSYFYLLLNWKSLKLIYEVKG